MPSLFPSMGSLHFRFEARIINRRVYYESRITPLEWVSSFGAMFEALGCLLYTVNRASATRRGDKLTILKRNLNELEGLRIFPKANYFWRMMSSSSSAIFSVFKLCQYFGVSPFAVDSGGLTFRWFSFQTVYFFVIFCYGLLCLSFYLKITVSTFLA